MAEKSASEGLIEKEEKNFLKRLGRELERLAHEGIEFTLPAAVIDHVANTERNLGFIRSKVSRHAREGVKEGDGLTMFKVRKVRVPAEEEGRAIIRTELMTPVGASTQTERCVVFQSTSSKYEIVCK